MAIPLRSLRISLAICKPLDGFELEDILPLITSTVAKFEDKRSNLFQAAVFESVNASRAAVLCVEKGASNSKGKEEDVSPKTPSLVADLARELASVVRTVDCGSFQFSSEAHRAEVSGAPPPLRVGNIVSLRRIFYSESRKTELLAYSCLALQKAYYHQIKGLVSSVYYEPITDDDDGSSRSMMTMMVGLALWENIQSACAFVDEEIYRRLEVYWRDMEVDMLKYEVCRVVYVTSSSDPTYHCK